MNETVDQNTQKAQTALALSVKKLGHPLTLIILPIFWNFQLIMTAILWSMTGTLARGNSQFHCGVSPEGSAALDGFASKIWFKMG